MWKSLASVVLFLAAGSANACQCAFFSEKDASASEVAFIFQVTSTEFYPGRSDDLSDDGVVAKIRIVHTLRGKPVATHMSYSIGWCCGLAVTAGRYYAAFLPSNTRAFAANFDNVVALNPVYVPSAKVPAGLNQLLRGRPAEGLLDHSRALLSPAPPPPCPPAGRKLGSNNSSKPTPLRGAA